MHQKAVNLFHIPFEQLFGRLKIHFPQYEYDYQKHTLFLYDLKKENLGRIRLPLHISIDHELLINNEKVSTIFLSIESGNAVICVMNGKTNVFHTTFSAYMTRKSQGMSQIKYLNKKGKSRAGSRVRLASTIDFFNKINEALSQLFEIYEFDRIALNCDASLIPYLFRAKVVCPFDKKDNRLYKIPLHIPKSNFTQLHKAIKKLFAPVLFYDQTNEALFHDAGFSEG